MSDRYKWIALTNTTLGIFMATINSSIILISLPAIFRGIGINPLQSSNISYLLWLLQGYLLVTAVLVVSLGRLGDIFGRVRMFNLGFTVFSLASIALALDPLHGGRGALWLVIWRLVQGVGGSMLFANSSAILVDAFPSTQRGLAVGINQVAAIGGSFIGLILGGVLSIINWRMVFWVSVPFGIIGTIWSIKSLRDNGRRSAARIDWWGNLTFAGGLTSTLVGIVYGIQPYGTSSMGWGSPRVLSAFVIGVLLLIAFFVIETRVEHPMFNLHLFKMRPFFTGSAANMMSSVARGGLQFMLVIWLQGIWLPSHGYAYVDTPLWAGIYMLPLTAGFLLAGPLSGWISDRHGARIIATTGMLVFGGSFLGLLLIPTQFHYGAFAAMLLLNGLGGGMFSAPNQTAVMNSVPTEYRGGGAGIQAAILNSGFVLSIGVFFSLMIVGLTHTLPGSLSQGLRSAGVSGAVATQVAHVPAVASLFSSFLGYNPLGTLLVSAHHIGVSAATWHHLTGKKFFPSLISAPFHSGLEIVFGAAITMAIIGSIFSALRGPRYVHSEPSMKEEIAELAQSGIAPSEPAFETEVVE